MTGPPRPWQGRGLSDARPYSVPGFLQNMS